MFDATVLLMTYRAGKRALGTQRVGRFYHEAMQRGVKLSTAFKAIEYEVTREGCQTAFASCIDGRI